MTAAVRHRSSCCVDSIALVIASVKHPWEVTSQPLGVDPPMPELRQLRAFVAVALMPAGMGTPS
jgi:hypothetical protein